MINGLVLCFSQPKGSRIVKDIRTVCPVPFLLLIGELVKLFITLLSEDSTQNKLGLTQVFHFGRC